MDFLRGKKTYVTAALAILGFWGAVFVGDMETADAVRVTVEALMVIFLRNGIAKDTQ